jgi:hypothetical protein
MWRMGMGALPPISPARNLKGRGMEGFEVAEVSQFQGSKFNVSRSRSETSGRFQGCERKNEHLAKFRIAKKRGKNVVFGGTVCRLQSVVYENCARNSA